MDIISRLKGVKRSGGGWTARCPAHKDQHSSLSVARRDDKWLLKCHAGCNWQTVVAALGIEASDLFDKSRKKRSLIRRNNSASVQRLQPAAHEPNDTERTARALELWNEALAPTGTLVDVYLASRKISLPDDVLAGDAIRFHLHCPYERERLPCMLALFTDSVTGEPRGIHRTALTAAGEKIGRMSLGPIGGCVIRLWPDESVEQGLVIGEGIETVLAAATHVEHRGTLLRPAWAAGFAGNLENFPVLSGVGALTILVDHDLSGTGQRAGEKCAHRWRNAGRQVIRLVPFQPGEDFADIASEVAAA